MHVTIAGIDDIPIDATSDLYRNLFDALHRYGDPYLPITLAVRERLALVISANIRVDPDYQWETLEPKLRSAVLDAFSFARSISARISASPTPSGDPGHPRRSPTSM